MAEFKASEAEEGCRLWLTALSSGVLVLRPDEADVDRAIELAIQIGHPSQDCLYLPLARGLEGTLLMADPKFSERARGHYSRVECLA